VTAAFRIGTRGSALALVQARWVAAALEKIHGPSFKTELVVIKTTGDDLADKPLTEIGGKGVFVKEIEKAIVSGAVNVAVHSLKDVPSSLPDGLVISAVPLREDPSDCVISRFGEQLQELPRGAVVGTSSLRRQAQIKAANVRVRVVPVRGNLDTRLRKLQGGDFDAIVVALAGVKRLGRESDVSQVLAPEVMLPCPGQGCLALEIREEDAAARERLAPLNHRESHLCALAERSMLAAIGGDCRAPVGGLARISKGFLEIEGLVADPSGKMMVREKERGKLPRPGRKTGPGGFSLDETREAELLGAKLGGRLLAMGGSEILLPL
jgi:hydroxymethylbilane synthase